MSAAALRIAVAGASGSLGREFLSVMEEESFPVAELRLFAGERSMGESLTFRGEELHAASEVPPLRDLDLLVLCTPGEASLDLIRLALRAQVPCLDCSGVLAASSDVPLVIADLGAHDRVHDAPLIGAPAGPALAWAPVLSALQREAGLERVVGTVLQAASAAGRAGIEALSGETVALLNQSAMPEPSVFRVPVAFDCVPHAEHGSKGEETAPPGLANAMGRLLGPGVRVAVTHVQVPTFGGEGSALAVETERPLAPERAARVLEAAPGVELCSEPGGPSTRAGVGRDVVLVGGLRVDPSQPRDDHGLLLWLSADPIRLAACNALKLARARFSLPPS